jgi:6,7-dimethyl-8-ribityllumazine synthase
MIKGKSSWRIGIAVSQYNIEITKKLLRCCEDELVEQGIRKKNIHVEWTPGAYELPFLAQTLAESKKYNAIICLGCVIKGETSHNDYIATWAALGIGHVGLKYGIPTLFGVLTPKSVSQAIERAKPGPLNRGREVAWAALLMIERIRNKQT